MFAESLNEVLARCLLKVSSRLDESLFMDWLPWLLIPSPLKYKGNTKKTEAALHLWRGWRGWRAASSPSRGGPAQGERGLIFACVWKGGLQGSRDLSPECFGVGSSLPRDRLGLPLGLMVI